MRLVTDKDDGTYTYHSAIIHILHNRSDIPTYKMLVCHSTVVKLTVRRSKELAPVHSSTAASSHSPTRDKMFLLTPTQQSGKYSSGHFTTTAMEQ